MSDERFILKNARHLAARYMEEILRPGDIAVDATMGMPQSSTRAKLRSGLR